MGRRSPRPTPTFAIEGEDVLMLMERVAGVPMKALA